MPPPSGPSRSLLADIYILKKCMYNMYTLLNLLFCQPLNFQLPICQFLQQNRSLRTISAKRPLLFVFLQGSRKKQGLYPPPLLNGTVIKKGFFCGFPQTFRLFRLFTSFVVIQERLGKLPTYFQSGRKQRRRYQFES